MTAPDVRALTIVRPWANLIARGHKLVENRSRPVAYRGLLVIHAGKRWDAYGSITAEDRGLSGGDEISEPVGFLAVARLIDVHWSDRANCDAQCASWGDEDCWHWRLSAVQPFRRVLPGGGRQSLFYPPPEVAALARQIASS